MLFKSVVTSAFGMVYVSLVSLSIGVPPVASGAPVPSPVPLAESILYHWYLNVPSPVAFTVNVTSFVFSIVLTDVGPLTDTFVPIVNFAGLLVTS